MGHSSIHDPSSLVFGIQISFIVVAFITFQERFGGREEEEEGEEQQRIVCGLDGIGIGHSVGNKLQKVQQEVRFTGVTYYSLNRHASNSLRRFQCDIRGS